MKDQTRTADALAPMIIIRTCFVLLPTRLIEFFMEGGCTWVTILVLSNSTRFRR